MSFAFNRLGKIYYAWKHAGEIEKEEKKAKGNSKRRKDELQFMPAALEVLETPPSPTARITLWLIIIIFLLAIVLASIGKTDVVATAAGQIIPSGRRKVIQPLETSRVQNIYVEEGQFVEKGELLIELNPVESTANKHQLDDNLQKNVLDAMRLKGITDNPAYPKVDFPPDAPANIVKAQQILMRSQASEYRSQLATFSNRITQENSQASAIRAEIMRLESVLPDIRARLEQQESLIEKNLTTRTQLLRVRQEVNDTSNQINVQRQLLAQANAAAQTARQEKESYINQYQNQRLEELAEAESRILGLEQEVIKVDAKVAGLKLTAPTNGVIQELKVSTVGGVVTPAQELMYVVPQDDVLEVRALLPNKDRGAVGKGDMANVKVEAFPFTRYGTIPAKLKTVSSDAIQDEKLGPVFAVIGTLERDYVISDEGERIRLTPGMAVMMEIKTDERRIIEFILTPIIKGFKEAARER